MQISEVLLAALVDTFARRTAEPSLLIAIEGHGREAIFDDLDVSRTVGWFTAIYPVRLDWRHTRRTSEGLEAVKQQLRQVPNGGIGYGLLRYLSDSEASRKLQALPRPEICFNYTNISSVFPASSSGAEPSSNGAIPQDALPGLSCDRRALRYYLIEINAVFAESHLSIELTYSQNVHHRATIEELGRELLERLRQMGAQALPAESMTRAASDFGAFGWSPADVDDIAAAISKQRQLLQVDLEDVLDEP
jgi:non-ribosomal peptide synthase protein (TIGR01720 family)